MLHAGAHLFGAIGSLIGLGSVTGAFVVMRWTRERAPARMVSLGMAAIGSLILVLAASRDPLVTLLCSFAIGVSVAVIVVTATALLQAETPLEMRGRVSSSSMAMMAMAQAVALVFAGRWAERIGIIHLFGASAAMLFAVALGGMWRLRNIGGSLVPTPPTVL